MKPLLICSFLLLTTLSSFAQREIDEDSNPKFMDRVYFGGGLGFSTGTSSYNGKYTYVGLYPMIGYMVNNQFSVGTTITYQYYSYPDVNLSISQYGFSPFARYNFGPVFLYSEFMVLNTPSYDQGASRRIYNRWLNGVGYSQPIGSRGSINAMALYDVLYNDSERVFNSPWVFRVFFSF
ncbi:MAG: hypothetical protein HOP08_06205 [Cyclobacteriaceae bacterium]|nr:hypothetical protein [Cyclobacteriaceae bacterium]